MNRKLQTLAARCVGNLKPTRHINSYRTFAFQKTYHKSYAALGWNAYIRTKAFG
jgi:hypothetical protein